MIPFFRLLGNKAQQPQHLLSQQVRWQHPVMEKGNIDQTRLAIADAPTDSSTAFSFLVIGDTDAGSDNSDDGSFSHMFARQVANHLQTSRFLLHTGDIAYPTGSYQNYFTRFLAPYRDLLTQLPNTPAYQAEDIVFNKALLSVPGNHDYSCDLSPLRRWKHLLQVVCDRLRKTSNIDLGHYGGEGGEAYGQTFLDGLSSLSPQQLSAHLAQHYSEQANSHNNSHPRHCLSYRPGSFTRLPNRYYTFRYGGVDFFALDSNTWNTAPDQPGFDQAQLTWLKNQLIHSWQTPNTIGRIVYLHHSPYTTEEFHWQAEKTLWVRKHLRSIFNTAALAVGLEKQKSNHRSSQQPSQSIVDLVIGGHAHCFEHLKSHNNTPGEKNIDWIVCGGSGAEVRRQRRGGPDILERVTQQGKVQTQIVAKSQQFVGYHRHHRQRQHFHSFVRVDVQPNSTHKIIVQPFAVTMKNEQWQTKPLAPLALGQQQKALTPEMAKV
ncbi:MAG: metallophosphoesterase [Cyanobacteria bacterium P01_C01_bin.69]